MRGKALFCGLFSVGREPRQRARGPELRPFPYAHDAAARWHFLYLLLHDLALWTLGTSAQTETGRLEGLVGRGLRPVRLFARLEKQV